MSRRRIIVIDGYNAIHKIPSCRRHLDTDLPQARDALLRICLDWKQTRRDVSEFIVVFDGSSSVLDNSASPPIGVRQIFTRTGETADDRIMAMAEAVPPGCEYVIVTDDNQIRQHSIGAGVERMSVSEFFAIQKSKHQRRRAAADEDSDDKILSPQDRKDINDSLRRAFGID